MSERRSSTGWPLALAGLAIFLAVALVLGLGVTASSSGSPGTEMSCQVGGGLGKGIPANYIPWLERAAAKYGLGARGFGIVAAIHKIESDFGRSNGSGVKSGTNFAGAAGPGQFLAGTWSTYGQDADGDGRKDVYSVPDSVFATANYLHASGAPGNWRAAIFNYNHADWYVNEVLRQAEAYQGKLSCHLTASAAAPLQIGQLNWNDASGAWGGSQKFAELAVSIGKRHGCSVISAKRGTRTTASGGDSDHWIGAKHSYAVDIDACSLAFPGGAVDQTARDVAAAFGLPGHTGLVQAIRGRYRIQLLWQTSIGGNHYNHVHIGLRNVCCLSTG